MLKVVFDTNIYISAFITPGGNGEEAYRKAIDKEIELYSSIPILTELASKLQDKFKWDTAHITSAIRHISNVAHVLNPPKQLKVLSDDADNRILECAIEANAEIIVTGDKHLLGLSIYGETKIMNLAEFLRF